MKSRTSDISEDYIYINNLIKVEKKCERDCLFLISLCLFSAFFLWIGMLILPLRTTDKNGKSIDVPWKPYVGLVISATVTAIGLPKPGLEAWISRKRIREYMMLKEIRVEYLKSGKEVNIIEIKNMIEKIRQESL